MDEEIQRKENLLEMALKLDGVAEELQRKVKEGKASDESLKNHEGKEMDGEGDSLVDYREDAMQRGW